MGQFMLAISRIKVVCISLLAFLSSSTVMAVGGPVWELRVTTAEVEGSCLLREDWKRVGGRYHYWELIQINDPAKYTGKMGEDWRFLRHHKFSFLDLKDAGTRVEGQDSRIFFNLEAIEERDLEFHKRMSKTTILSNPYAYVDALREAFKKPNLLPATVVHYVSEKKLYGLNRLNSFNPFQDKIDGREVIVPLDQTVCDLKFSYLMKGAKARYNKNFLGKKVLISNETIPFAKDKKTFAEEWLEAN